MRPKKIYFCNGEYEGCSSWRYWKALVAGGMNRKADVMNLIRSLKLRPVDAGPVEIAGHLERMTVLLLSINKANKVKESGIEITGI